MVRGDKQGSCCPRSRGFLQTSNKKKNPQQQQQQGSFLGLLAAVRWPACGEWIMSVRPCEAVPCPPEPRKGGPGGVLAALL